MSFFLIVVLPTAVGALLVLVLGRRFEHVSGMQEPELGGLDALDPDSTVTLTGEVAPLGELIPSPVRGDPPVLAWSLEVLAGSDEKGAKLSRWTPFILRREGGEDIRVRRLLAFDPKRSRVTARIHEDHLTADSLHHLRTQQKAAFAQLRQLRAWVFEEEPHDESAAADVEPAQSYAAAPGRRYNLSVLRPGDALTTVARVQSVRPSEPTPPEFFLFPDYSYPLPYLLARSPWHGQGRFILTLAGWSAAAMGTLSTIGWVIGFLSR